VAITSNGGSVYRPRGRERGGAALSEINITPFVDVLLVVLVIFMVTAHVMEFGIEINVPEVRQVKDTTKELPVVQITKTGDLYLNEKEVNINELAGIVRKRFAGQAVYVRADKETPFDPIAQVLSVLGEAKIGVNIVTKPEDTSTRRRR
jgi:biopolymer transport protein ExbD/biopolymer transport protein TolR